MLVFGIGAALPLLIIGLLSREALQRWRKHGRAASTGPHVLVEEVLDSGDDAAEGRREAGERLTNDDHPVVGAGHFDDVWGQGACHRAVPEIVRGAADEQELGPRAAQRGHAPAVGHRRRVPYSR